MGKKVTDQDIIRIARIRLDETANSTYSEVEHDTQLSVERGVIWLIHRIEFFVNNLDLMNELAAGGTENAQMQVTKASQTGIVFPNSNDYVAGAKWSVTRSATIGTDAGPLWIKSEAYKTIDYPIPLAYASQSIFAGVVGSDAATGIDGTCRIFYTIAEVTDKFFFRVAQALQ